MCKPCLLFQEQIDKWRKGRERAEKHSLTPFALLLATCHKAKSQRKICEAISVGSEPGVRQTNGSNRWLCGEERAAVFKGKEALSQSRAQMGWRGVASPHEAP